MESDLTKELNKLIQEQTNLELEKNKDLDQDDDLLSSMDIDEFERKIKNRNTKQSYNNNPDVDNDDFYDSKKQKKSMFTKDVNVKPPISYATSNKQQQQQAQSKIESITNEIMMNKMLSQPKDEDTKVNEIINSKNENEKNKKLKELVQKNKELYVNLEKERALRMKIEKELTKIKLDTDNQLANLEGKGKRTLSEMGTKPQSKTNTQTFQNDDGQDWKKKANELEKKIQELRMQSTNLRNDLNKAMRILAREVGENFDIDQVLNEENGWKARAQQIEVLKAKVKELQQRLNTNMNFSAADSMYENSGIKLDTQTSIKSSSGASKADEKRKEMEALKNQIEELKAENENLQTKVKGMSSRKTVLENEIKEIKNEYEKNKKILLEKSQNDDKYITALKQELDKLKNQSLPVQTKVIYRDRPNPEIIKKESDDKTDENKLKQDLKYMKLELDRKEEMIKQLLMDKIKDNTPITEAKPSIPADPDKINKLESVVKALKADIEELAKAKLGVKSSDPDGKAIRDLAIHNSQLRRKIDELEQKLRKKQLEKFMIIKLFRSFHQGQYLELRCLNPLRLIYMYRSSMQFI